MLGETKPEGFKYLPVTSIIGLLSEGLMGCMLIRDSSWAFLGSNVAFTLDIHLREHSSSIIGLLSEGLMGCMLICDSSRASLGSNVAFTWNCAVSGPLNKSK